MTVVDDGRAAVETAKATHFDLIAMDIEMPELDGLRACREIREWEQATGEHVPIIAMTAHAMKGDRERCLDAGMDGYVAKPIRTEELVAAIAQALHGDPADLAIDGTSLLSNLDGDRELLRKLIERFTADSPQQMSRIHAAINNRDAEELRLAAHSIKGSLGNFVAAQACALAQDLENAGRQSELSHAGPLVTAPEAELARVVEEVRTLVDSETRTVGESAH